MSKILILEDSKTLNTYVYSSLTELNYKCTSCYTFKDAVQVLENNSFEFIILDLNLPDIKTEDLLKEIKQITDAKIIVLSSINDDKIRESIFKYGILDYLNKNVTLEENIKEITNIINRVEKNQQMTILAIDDSKTILKQLHDILEPRNYNILTSENGLDSYQILKTKEVNLVILDLELPDIHGLKLLKNIRRNISKNLPILILSSNTSTKVFRECLLSGANDFIKKPFIEEELLIKVDLYTQSYLDSLNLKKSNQLLEQYKIAVDEASLISKTNSKGIITYVNKQFEEISGYKKEDLIGKPHNIIRHPDTPSEVFKDLWQTIKVEKKSWKGKIKNKKKNGDVYIVNTVVNPILDSNNEIVEFIAIRNDITELENAKKYFKKQYSITSEKFEDVMVLSKSYEDAIDKSSIILRFDKNKILTYVNDLFLENTKYTREDIIGKSYYDLKHPELRVEDVDNIEKDIKEHGIWKGRLKSFTKDNKEIHFIATVSPIRNKNNEIIEYISIRNDITDIVNLHEEINETQREIIYKIGEIGETRSKETGNHVKRVALYSELLALKSGLSSEESKLLRLASPMHDIGKVGIPDSILNKPGKLTTEEFDTMKTHTKIGYDLLRDSSRAILKASAIVSNEHHEKWDGTGYPKGLKKEEIHIFGRITAICDVFDALAHERPYKKAWSLEKILELFNEQKGKHFDPKLMDIFLENLDLFLEIKNKYN